MKSFAIVVVCYKRLDGIKRLIKSLEMVDYDGRNDITLIFSIDKSEDNQVTEFAKEYQWGFGEKIIRTFKERQGLKNHILQCGDYTDRFDILVVLEDDVYVSDSMYRFAYNAADFYYEDDRVAGISLYSFQKNWLKWIYRFEPQRNAYDAFFLKIAQSWGQVWTKRKWRLFKNWLSLNPHFGNSKNIPEYLNTWPDSSWLKFHDKYCIETNRYFVYPYVSVSTNFSDAGEHSKKTITDHQVELMYGKKHYSFCVFGENAVIYDEYMDRVGLSKYLNVDEEELCVDFWGTKKHLYKKYRFLLSTEKLRYNVVKSFSLSLRPIEASVINSIEGNGIYLYDLEIKHKNVNKIDSQNLLAYSLRTQEFIPLFKYSINRLLIKIREKISRKK